MARQAFGTLRVTATCDTTPVPRHGQQNETLFIYHKFMATTPAKSLPKGIQKLVNLLEHLNKPPKLTFATNVKSLRLTLAYKNDHWGARYVELFFLVLYRFVGAGGLYPSLFLSFFFRLNEARFGKNMHLPQKRNLYIYILIYIGTSSKNRFHEYDTQTQIWTSKW